MQVCQRRDIIRDVYDKVDASANLYSPVNWKSTSAEIMPQFNFVLGWVSH